MNEREILFKIAEDLQSQKETPCAIFDLDDTIFDTRSRTKRILEEYMREHSNSDMVNSAIKMMSLSDVAYYLRETLQNIQILDLALCKDIESFWRSRFFRNGYVIEDEVFAGCHDLVMELQSAGVEIFYLTGRLESDNPHTDMREGTKTSLRGSSFPLKSEDHLILKRVQEEDDCLFKSRICESLDKNYKVIASFENQPENANMMVTKLSKARIYFHQSIHRPLKNTKESLHDQIISFSDYLSF